MSEEEKKLSETTSIFTEIVTPQLELSVSAGVSPSVNQPPGSPYLEYQLQMG